MTNQEAKALVEWFKIRKGKTLKLNDDGVDCVIKVIEKQMPKKLKEIYKAIHSEDIEAYGKDALFGYCSNCNILQCSVWNSEYCGDCGQKLDWKE